MMIHSHIKRAAAMTHKQENRREEDPTWEHKNSTGLDVVPENQLRKGRQPSLANSENRSVFVN